MQIYANHIQIHIKIASPVPPHLLERILEALYHLSQKDTPGRREVRTSAEVGTWGTRRAVCALVRGGLGRLGEAHADGLNTAVQSEMCGWSKINVETPGSEGLHSAATDSSPINTEPHWRTREAQREPRKPVPGLKELTGCEQRSHPSLDFCKTDTRTHGLRT